MNSWQLAFDYWFWFPCLKVDGGYDEWGNYSECSATCGVGNQVRMRTCTNPVPQHGGKPCMGSHSESRECNTQPCPGTTVILYWCSTLHIFFKWSRVIEVFLNFSGHFAVNDQIAEYSQKQSSGVALVYGADLNCIRSVINQTRHSFNG